VVVNAIAVPLEQGGVIRIEVADDGGEVPFGKSTDRVLAEASRSLQKCLPPIRHVAEAFLDQFALMARQPEVLTVQFAVQFDTEAQLVIVQAGASANFQISMEWRRGAGEADAPLAGSEPDSRA
jgi:Trypsin-co-occurring domain 1